MTTVGELARAYADLICETFPARATYLGRHEHDDRLGEYSREAIEAFGARVRALRRDLAETGDDSLDAQGLDVALGTELLEVEDEQQWRRNPEVAVDTALGACAALLVRETQPVESRLGALAERLRAVPAYLEAARRTWSDVPRFWSEAAYETAKAGAVFLRSDLPGAVEDAPTGTARSVCDAAATAADAFDALAEHVAALPDGGTWVAGERAVQERLRVQHRLDDTPAGIAARGEELVSQTLDALAALDPDWRRLVTREKARHPAAGELLDVYRDEMERARRFVEEHAIARPPSAALDVRASPRFWADLVPYAAYDPPGFFDSGATGIFWVTVPDGDDAAERLPGHARPSIVLTAVHEGYPGHHLQLSRANEAGLVSALVESPLFAEGWAFYCESMIGEAGYYGDDRVVRAFQLKDQLWRAVRVVVDMGLHCGDLDVDAAVDQLVRVADLERPSAVAEVRRYTSSPTYQICYAIGKQEILRLRDQCLAGEPDLSLGRFHDELLSYGTLPVPLVARAMTAPRDPQ